MTDGANLTSLSYNVLVLQMKSLYILKPSSTVTNYRGAHGQFLWTDGTHERGGKTQQRRLHRRGLVSGKRQTAVKDSLLCMLAFLPGRMVPLELNAKLLSEASRALCSNLTYIIHAELPISELWPVVFRGVDGLGTAGRLRIKEF